MTRWPWWEGHRKRSVLSHHVLQLAFSSNPPVFRRRERVSDEDMPEREVERLICQVSDGERSRFHSQLGAKGCRIQQTATASLIFYGFVFSHWKINFSLHSAHVFCRHEMNDKVDIHLCLKLELIYYTFNDDIIQKNVGSDCFFMWPGGRNDLYLTGIAK